jgi:hypothetical protein
MTSRFFSDRSVIFLSHISLDLNLSISRASRRAGFTKRMGLWEYLTMSSVYWATRHRTDLRPACSRSRSARCSRALVQEGASWTMQSFDRAGLGHVISSWIGTGQNLPISPDQLTRYTPQAAPTAAPSAPAKSPRPVAVQDKCGRTRVPRCTTAKATSGTARPRKASIYPRRTPRLRVSSLITARPASNHS